MDEHSPRTGREEAEASGEGVGESLRAAVERTLAATAGSASGTRQRALELLDDAVKRGQVAREQVTRRGEEATTRLAEALGELRAADQGDRDALHERLRNVERRLARIEALIHAASTPEAAAEPRPEPEKRQGDPLRDPLSERGPEA